MTDWYLLLTPFLMLAVIALVRFVGCNQFFGLEPTVPIVDPPFEMKANPGDRRVELSWQHPAGKAKSFRVYHRQPTAPFTDDWVPATPGPAAQHTVTVTALADGTPLTNGVMYCFEVTAIDDNGTESAPSNEACAQPGLTTFVLTKTLADLRNNFSGWVGMVVQVAANPLMVTALGRIIAPMNTQMRVVRIVAAADGTTLGSVAVSAGAATGEFAYAGLSAEVRLEPFAVYYVVMQVQDGGEQWYDYVNTTVQTTAAASVTAAVFLNGQPFVQPNSAGHAYGPVDFRYFVTML